MRWRIEFYHERRGALAHYDVDARLPGEAVLLGWNAVLAEDPSLPRSGRMSLFDRAQAVSRQDASGWVLYRIMRDSRGDRTGDVTASQAGGAVCP